MMSLVWILTCHLLLVGVTFAGTGRYVCDQSRKMVVFHYSRPVLNSSAFNIVNSGELKVESTVRWRRKQTDVYDIYLEGLRDTCSKQSGMVSGSGDRDDPYTLVIVIGTDDREDTMNKTCYVEPVPDGKYNVKVVIQQMPYIVLVGDQIFSLSCKFTKVPEPTEVLGLDPIHIVGKPARNIPAVDTSRGRLFVVNEPSTEISSDLPLGKNIRLQAEVNGTGAVGVHVTNCKVSPSPGKQPVLTLLDDTGCPTDLQIMEPFHGINKDGSIAQSGLFQVFKFTTSNTLYFTCELNFCYVHGDPFCAGNHCQPREGQRRTRRETSAAQNDTGSTAVVSTFVTVSMGPESSSQTMKESNVEKSCIESAEFILSTAILSALLLVTLITAASMCARIGRSKRKSNHSSGARLQTPSQDGPATPRRHSGGGGGAILKP